MIVDVAIEVTVVTDISTIAVVDMTVITTADAITAIGAAIAGAITSTGRGTEAITSVVITVTIAHIDVITGRCISHTTLIPMALTAATGVDTNGAPVITPTTGMATVDASTGLTSVSGWTGD